MISDKTKEFIKEHAQPHGKTLYKIENGKAKAVSRWINSLEAEIACEIEKKEFIKKAHDFFSLHEPDEWVQSLGGVGHFFNKEKFFNDFIKAMEE